MALVAGRDGLQRSSGGDDIHPFFRLDTQKAPRLQLNHEPNASSLRASNQEMTNQGENEFNDRIVETVTAQEQIAFIPESNAVEPIEQHSLHDVSGSSDPAPELSGTTITHGKPVRKRRKLGSKPESLGTGKQGTLPWYQPVDLSSKESLPTQKPVVPTTQTVGAGEENLATSVQHKTEASLDQHAQLSISKGNSDSLPRIHVSPAKKVMKLRADGKLFSPPKKDVVIRSAKGGKKSGKEVSKRLAIIKYGDTTQSRREIGETIERILNSTLRIKPLIKKDGPGQEMVAKAEPPLKVEPHPFFLAQRKLEGQKDHSSALPKSKNTSRASSPHRNSERAVEKPAVALLFGSSTSRTIFPNESQEPIWPPQDMLHVRSLSLTKETTTTIDRLWITSVARKAKEPAVYLEETEEIWYPLKGLITESKLMQQLQRESDTIPAPARQIIIRSELQTIISGQLKAKSDPKVRLGDTENKTSSGTYACKSTAAQRLFDTLPTSSSAFDRFTCENQSLTAKYAPKSSTDVLQPQKPIQLLKSWLSGSSIHSTSSTVSTASIKQKRKSLKKRRQTSEFDDFIATSEDDEPVEDSDRSDSQVPDMTGFRFEKYVPRHRPTTAAKLTAHSLSSTRAVVLNGPHGCGKTAAVYALAQEIGFEVFEINAGSRRSGRDILERVGDMTKNHLVSRLSSQPDKQQEPTDEQQPDTEDTRQEIASGKQSTMQSFFKKQPVSKPVLKPVKPKPTNSIASTEIKSKLGIETSKTSKSQKQSLILIEEVDVLFEEDKQFWATVISLITTSKRPIIMTCNDESVLPFEVMAQCLLVQFDCPPMATVAEYLLLIAAHEGHLLDWEAVSSLYTRTGLDLRASIMQLSFWCQMAVKDDMNGLNWILFPQDYQDDKLAIAERRVMSQRTFLPHMGTLGNNQAWPVTSNTNAIQWMHDATLEWNVQAEDLMFQDAQLSKHSQLEQSASGLSAFTLAYDVLSVADILQSTAFLDEVKTDYYFSEVQQFNNFTINPPVLQSTPEIDMATGDSDIIASLSHYAQSTISGVQHGSPLASDYYRVCDSIINRKKPLLEHQTFIRTTIWDALDPLVGCALEQLENMATDFAPYIRSIISYDNRLEWERDRLAKLLSDGSRSGKRQRTTRASRAALEGGHKANTRREKWFECELDLPLVLETAGKDWQEIAWTAYQRDIRKWKWTQQAELQSSEDELCS